GFVRARYRFLQGKFHPYVHLDLGGGQIRHALDLSTADQDPNNPLVDATTAQAFNSAPDQATRDMIRKNPQLVCASPNSCVDSIALGLVLLGGGAGVWYDVAKHVALIADLNLIGA